MSTRYAVYFVPARHSSLAAFGASVIGYDVWTGLSSPAMMLPSLGAVRSPEVVDEPARYGFHATLKAPFHLRDDADEGDVLTLAQSFAECHSGAAIGRLHVRAMSRFIALVPDAPPASLGRLADDCVRAFDGLRAPLTEADRARRLKTPLTEQQARYLEAWGYPYVFEDFRFHMTLTGALPEEQQAAALADLAVLWKAVAQPVAIDAITIAKQPTRASRFKVLATYALATYALASATAA